MTAPRHLTSVAGPTPLHHATPSHATAGRGVGLRPANVAKRVVDIVTSAALLLALSPLFLFVAVLIALDDGAPVFFRQERVGFRDQPFKLLKFRSMRRQTDDSALRAQIEAELGESPEAEIDGSFKLANDDRITRVGRRLRAWSIDELPQLVNVLRGEMSLVGPRPALPWEADLFPPRYRRRTDVLPGMTGLWQVSGRSRVSTVEMLQYDLDYVDSWSAGLDMRILWHTLPAVVRGDGAR
jgi:lipopolysaccharide/colanic/teichoic acid biosynthesis glycosyltransferase